MTPKNYYTILGVKEDAGLDEIKKVYRKLAKQCHPDTNPGDKQAEEKFKEISEAYDVLNDPQKRQKYDQMRKFGFGGRGMDAGGFDFRNFDPGQFRQQGEPGGGFSFEGSDVFGGLGDLFSQFFDRGEWAREEPAETTGERDIHVAVSIPLELSVTGGKTRFTVSKVDVCPVCRGSGAKPGSRTETCSACRGRGTVTIGHGGFGVSRPCSRCLGKGKIVKNPCDRCSGSGTVQGKKTYSVTIPAGLSDGEQIRLAGQGQPKSGNRAAGDLIATVRIEPHRFFERVGNDIYCNVELNLAQAVLGSAVRVKTVDGKKVQLKIPPGTQTGTLFRIPGMGVERKGKRADQYVRIKVKIPEKLTEEEKELMDRFAQKSGMKR